MLYNFFVQEVKVDKLYHQKAEKILFQWYNLSISKYYGCRIINESLETFYEINKFFGINIIIKPMFNNKNEIELTHKYRLKKELFNGANRFWKFVVSAEIFGKNRS